ncbi:MAG: DUF4258 domain-containing protein [Candidatus Diapherotrites archaeon]
MPDLSEKLRNLRHYEIVFTKHAELRLVQRQISKEMVISDLRNPKSLKLAEKQPPDVNEEKFKLWFIPFKRTAFIYVIIINHFRRKLFVKTVIKQKLIWQKKAEKNEK